MFGLGKKKNHYRNAMAFTYYSFRYHKHVTVPYLYPSDGATGAIDVCPKAWLVHDVLCDSGVFDDGTQCTNWQASMILSDILKEEGYWIRQFTWLCMTWLFGGGKARENGMF